MRESFEELARSTMDNPTGLRAATAMQENNFDLVSTIATMVEKMTAALLDKGLITTDKKSEASIITYTDFRRAEILVDCVRSIMRFSPDKIYTFIAILRQLHPGKENCPVAMSLEKGKVCIPHSCPLREKKY